MRILEGYSKAEQKELEYAKDNGFLSAITLIRGISNGDCHCHELSKKYCREDINDNNQLAKDIVDFYCGNAKFPEQKYYVQLIKNNNSSYLNKCSPNGFYMPDSCRQDKLTQTQFTEQEIKDIDPRYMAFAVPVEEDNE
ncbi:DUF1642 domain-containing protein [Companilactobacillus sp. HBUAS56275]|uniref:DUF1642 domain-containing protein n=1 Tax=Companilactobacillus sp. HBUAS56275 TaxID=3109364 RepID=UPI002FEF50DA